MGRIGTGKLNWSQKHVYRLSLRKRDAFPSRIEAREIGGSEVKAGNTKVLSSQYKEEAENGVRSLRA